ncbi:MAG: hypothetical protein LBL00_00875, partial [Endomicrobium sp.]|nr:hypothetical protein [Endomicrobium sp.]
QQQKRKTKATTTTKSPVRFAATPFKKWELTTMTTTTAYDKIEQQRQNRLFSFVVIPESFNRGSILPFCCCFAIVCRAPAPNY